MSYQKWRDDFLQAFGREFPKAPEGMAQLLLRDATGSQRANEILSSIDVGEREQTRIERREEARDKRVAARATEIGSSLITNGDPRGYAYILTCPSGRTYDFGQRGLGIPGRGLPARCFQ